jgi:hypothetical protein
MSKLTPLKFPNIAISVFHTVLFTGRNGEGGRREGGGQTRNEFGAEISVGERQAVQVSCFEKL